MENKIKEIYGYLDHESYDQARGLLNSELEKLKEPNSGNVHKRLELFGALLDIGIESGNNYDIIRARNFLKRQQKLILKIVQVSNYYYILAGALQALNKIWYQENPGVHELSTIKNRFQEPIQFYWMAYNNCPDNNFSLKKQIAVNISISLFYVGRICESLQFLDDVLKQDPCFPQALATRSMYLERMVMVCNSSPTAALYFQIYTDMETALESKTVPKQQYQQFKHSRDKALSVIKKEGYDITNAAQEAEESNNEFKQHSPSRQFALINHLTLNEHALYCRCVASAKDDIRIGVSRGAFTNPVLPKLELLLNRMKSEFGFARHSYFQSIEGDYTPDFDIGFSDLMEDEILSPATELQRGSFRICYGILDKIALGICKLYDLPAKLIHFETFWTMPDLVKHLDDRKNFHLSALYSIALDLNSEKGELRHFKNWRNKMEHNLLIIQKDIKLGLDPYKVFEDTDFLASVRQSEFRRKTLHLLQLTRSAILSFVFCVRLQLIEHEHNKTAGMPMVFKK